jgi:hypothetical protein
MQTIYPDSLIADYNSGTIGVGEIYNPAPGALRMKIVTPEGSKEIDSRDAKTYGGVITTAFANWLTSKYKVKLEETEGGFFVVKYPHDI